MCALGISSLSFLFLKKINPLNDTKIYEYIFYLGALAPEINVFLIFIFFPPLLRSLSFSIDQNPVS